MKKKRWIIILVVFFVVIGVGVGVKRYMEKQELVEIQKDLADYLYNNYRIYTKNEEKSKEIKEAYNKGNGSLTDEEYLKRMKDIREYSDIEKIEFTGFSVGPMNGLEVYFVLNDVYSDMTTLDTKSAETDTWIYSFNSGNDRNSYVLEKRQQSIDSTISEKTIVYYEGGLAR